MGNASSTLGSPELDPPFPLQNPHGLSLQYLGSPELCRELRQPKLLAWYVHGLQGKFLRLYIQMAVAFYDINSVASLKKLAGTCSLAATSLGIKHQRMISLCMLLVPSTHHLNK
ncbi:PREDICTED: uncharacterized protein LOC101293848 [Fragaria vesca subsp. vesca]